MWLSASAFFHQYHRVYSPIAFGKKLDAHGDFIREYVPELKDFPAKYIYQPWDAPVDVQKRAKCIIGEDYPQPIVQDKESKAECIARIQRAYKAGLHGDDPRVLDGTANDYLDTFGKIDKAEALAQTKRKSKEEISDDHKKLKQQKLDFVG